MPILITRGSPFIVVLSYQAMYMPPPFLLFDLSPT